MPLTPTKTVKKKKKLKLRILVKKIVLASGFCQRKAQV